MLMILGGQGYVGSAIASAVRRQGLAFRIISRRDVNYSDSTALRQLLSSDRPEFLINAAGYTGRPNVDACEKHRTECLAGNALLPGVIRDVCEELEIPWGHVSSGCIYTGSRPDGSGFLETDPPNFSFRQNNCSFYSGCKALGEELLVGAANCYIWRLRIPFDENDSGRNYISKMMRYDTLLQATNSLSHLTEFAECCVASWTRKVPFGIYNLTNPGQVCTSEVVDMIRKHGLSSRDFRFFESEAQFMSKAAITPRSNCVLDSSKAINAGLPLSPVTEALDRAMRNWKSA
ncbi:MAG: sugar nucleotide-binding protein [Planctomyces sp.]